jgi:para-aminobenzoate synthetase/4-amino-4-deoxychorismate lyase
MAFINTGNSHILSLSPELFFRKRGSSIISRPMKGTAKRGLTLDKDKENLKWLARNKKTRAENIMIVDLLRNDLGKISQEVRVPRLFEIEKHRTLYQMTSTVKAKLKNNMKMKDIFFSLFPCGSVTGAPKIKTMEIIKDLEKEPRGVYTGAIGYISPQRDACFNIAIRTALIKDGKGEMGVGGGIVYDSIESSEYEEAMLKAKFLTQHFSEIFLIESMLWEENVGYFLLSLHLKRLRNSCGYFSIPLDIKQLKRKLIILEESLGRGKFKIRVSVSLNGDVKIEKEPLAEIATPVKVKLSLQRIDPQNMFLYHKTTHRDLYDRERKTAQEEGYFEVIFLNTNEEVTEGSITNVFISKNGLLYTPPIKCGLLGGVLREYFLKEGRAKEEVLYLKDILEAEKVYIGNSVRGILEAQISLADLINERKIKHTPNIIKASIQQ